MGAQISSLTGRSTVAKKMLMIGGCELSLERNPVGEIQSVTVDENTGQLVDEEVKVEEGKGRLKVPVRSPTVHRYGDDMLVIGGCRGPKDHISEVQILRNIGDENSKWDLHETLKLN